ncbi:MAG: hypothetical protein JXA54_04875 [Candidatus Heimdallarchaeota archaeon]|nr:hypothetical protein [Candidatus Heimdallarchaeota archaeon]
MSEHITKAESFEIKGKWKNAAETYLLAAKIFLENKENDTVRNLIKKAIENAEKSAVNDLIVESVFMMSEVVSGDELNEIFSKAIKPLNKLIEEQIPKKRYDLILDYINKKEIIVRAIGVDLEETLLEKGGFLHEQAFLLITNKSEEIRKQALEDIRAAANVFLEVNKKDEKIQGEIIALTLLLEDGYLKEGLEFYNEIVDYCHKEKLQSKAEAIIQIIIDYSNEILEGKGPKKLVKAVKETFSNTDPGGEFLKIGIDKALEINSKVLINNASKIQADFAEQMFDKKNYSVAKNFYEKALQLLITINDKENASFLAKRIAEKAYSILDLKGLFNEGLNYLSVINQMENINLDYLGEFYFEKAEKMYSREKLELALADYLNSGKAFLAGKLKKKFTTTFETIYSKALELIEKNNKKIAMLFVDNITNILESEQAYDQIGKNLSKISVAFVKTNNLKEANDYSIKAVESLIKAGNTLEAGNSHKTLGESLINLGLFDTASYHLIEAAKLFKQAEAVDKIPKTVIPLVNSAKLKLTEGNTTLAQKLIMDASICAEQKDPIAQMNALMDFVDHAIQLNQPILALDDLKYITSILESTYPEESKKIIKKILATGKQLINSKQNYSIGKDYIVHAVNTLESLNEISEASKIILEFGELLFNTKQDEMAKDLLLLIDKTLNSESNPEEFGEKLTLAGKLLIEHNIIDDGVDLLRKSIGAYLSLGIIKPVSNLSFYCSERANSLISNNEVIYAKHLFFAAMEFSSLVNLETQEQILTNATNSFLEAGDLYTVKEFYDFARNNLEGEKDYLLKLGRLIIYQGSVLRDKKGLFDEASEFIRNGIQILNQVAMLEEAGEASLAQGIAFIEKEHFIYGEELIETGAQIFIQIDNIERSGDAFLSLTEINIKRKLWTDAFRQINLALKSFQGQNQEKLTLALLKTAEIGYKALVHNPDVNRKFAISCFDLGSNIAKENNILGVEIDIGIEQSRAFAHIKDYQTTYNTLLQTINLLEEYDESVKSPFIADEFSGYAIQFISENELQLGLHIIDLATGIYLRLGKPINASEVYMKACNALLKMNQIGEGVKLVLLASDTLMVAEEYENAVKILEEILDLLYGLNDYNNASIVTGQIVTVHQKTGNMVEQKNVIYRLMKKAEEVIKSGKIMDGEQLWEQASNYSISTNLEFSMEINNKRINSLTTAGMYNSVNNAFKQILKILDKNIEPLVEQGNRIAGIAAELFAKDELVLAKNFILTANEFFKNAEHFERATKLCITMSQNFIQKGDESNGIELIDCAANIANETKGAHEAAKIYLSSGFVLIEKGYPDSGRLSINKAIDIEIQTKNMTGCNELGEMTLQKANEFANSDLDTAIEIYSRASSIFERASSYSKAGEVQSIITSNYININKAQEAMDSTDRAIDLYIKGQNIESAALLVKQTVESSRRFFDENEMTKGVLILERSRLLVEKISRYDLLNLIIVNYIAAARHNLPNRKSAIGVFFLTRAFDLARSSPDSEEIKRVIDLSLKLSREIISNKNAISGAKIIEIVMKQDIAKTLLLPLVSETVIDALKLTLDVEWNMIGKITKDAIRFFKNTNQLESISQVISILTKRANADILQNKPQLGFFFIEHSLKLIKETEIPSLYLQIGSELFEQLLTLNPENNFELNYRMLGYCYQIFQETKNMDYIERVGKEFVKLGSKDLIGNMQSIRGYEALLTARDIAVQTQSDSLISTVTLAFLDFALQQLELNSKTTVITLDDIIDGLKDFEVPHSKRASIEFNLIGEYVKNLTSLGEKVTKIETEYKSGKKIVENCTRILVLSKNQSYVEKEIIEVNTNQQKYLKRSNRDSAYKLRQIGLALVDLNSTNDAVILAENSFKNAQSLFEKKKYQEAIYYLETSMKLNEVLSINTELKNIGLFSLSTGDRLVNEVKIPESMVFYDIATEAFDLANDDENSNRLVNRIFQTREWDADITIAYNVYQIASDSAVRIKNKQKAVEIATKCFNRGTAFIDQPRIPIELSMKFISLAGKVYEDIGAIKEAANCYDRAILKYIRLMKTRKGVETVIEELLTRTAIDRMASCDMDSLETIFLRVMELAELKKSKFIKIISQTLKLVNSSKAGDAWDLMASIPLVSHGRIRKILKFIKNRIVYELQTNGTFDRTIFSATDRSLPLSDYLIDNLLMTKKIEGQPINKDVFISLEKINSIRDYIHSEYELWGRIELNAITTEFGIQHNDVTSILRREFLSSHYMSLLDDDQKIYYSSERLKAEISVILNRERKKTMRFDPMQIANEMRIPPDIIKEVLREIACEEVVENLSL